jgi:hypothetical protein
MNPTMDKLSDVRKVITVFIASPGDLKIEREIAKKCVDRLNSVRPGSPFSL